MKKITLIINFLLIIFLLTSCKASDVSNSDIPTETEVQDEQSDFEIPSDINVAHIQSDRIYCEDLQQVENEATIIVRAVARGVIDQKVDTIYDDEIQEELPTYGYTKREIEVTQVHNGDVMVGDKLVILQAYYVWTHSDGYKQLVSSTSVKPVVEEMEYLMFLRYDKKMEGYSIVGDYQGIFAIPTDEIKVQAEEGVLEQSDLDIYYNYEPLHYMFPLYNEVAEKYFN